MRRSSPIRHMASILRKEQSFRRTIDFQQALGLSLNESQLTECLKNNKKVSLSSVEFGRISVVDTEEFTKPFVITNNNSFPITV